MKRMLSLLLTAAMLLGMLSVCVFADDEFAYESGSAAAETTDTLTYNGTTMKAYRAWSTVDSRWATMTLGTSTKTVKSSGSLVVALTKVLIQSGFWLDGEEYTAAEGGKTVVDMVEMLNAYSYSFYPSGSAALAWAQVPSALSLGSAFKNEGALLTSETPVTDEIDQIYKWLNKGYHLLISVKTDYGTHWVAVDEGMTLGVNDGDVYVMDGDPNTNIDRYPLLTDYTYIEEIHAYSGGNTHAHNLVETVTPANCTESGVTTYFCPDDGEGYYVYGLEPLGHSMDAGTVTKAATCTEAGVITYICTRCGEKYLEELAPTGHTYNDTVTQPTCTQQGYTTHTCTQCGYSYTDTYVPAKGHTSTSVVTAPTCTEDGYTTYTCTVCGYSYKDHTTAALGHNYEKTSVVPATKTTYGYTVYTCSRCGDSYQGDKVVPHSHNFGDWEISKGSTATKYGTQTRTCTICGYAETEKLKYLNPFTDLDSTSYYYYPVLWAAGRTPQITAGKTSTTFAPSESCTRAQVVAFLHRANNNVAPTSEYNPFTDVAASAYYYDDVLWGVEHEIVYGMTENTFEPDRTVTRGQFITFLWRMAGSPTVTGTNPFNDVHADDYYYDAVLWGYENGYVYGISENTFAPSSPCTRGQVVTFLYRYYGD